MKTTHERFIATGLKGLEIFWGIGDTRAKAVAKCRVKNPTVYRFTSELPFAPTNREALETEADAYMSGLNMAWVRCEREELQ